MAGLGPAGNSSDFRVRRWDAVVLGSGVRALVAAARLGVAGHRVLVVEEEAAARSHPALREPFFLSGALDGGVLDAVLREISLPLIDRRRIRPQPIAYQVVTPDRRVDIAETATTIDELVAWGLAKPEAAADWAAETLRGSESLREILLVGDWVRTGRPRSRGSGEPVANGFHAPKTPFEAFLSAQERALSNLASCEPSPEVRARLIGSALVGGAGFDDAAPWLIGLLRRRVESVYGEFRTLPGSFEWVSADGHPGIQVTGSREVWLGRVLVLGTTTTALRGLPTEGEQPAFLEARPAQRRITLRFRVRRALLPEAMAPRVILVDDPGAPLRGDNHLMLSVHRDPEDSEQIDLVVRSLIEPGSDLEALAEAVEGRLRALMPFVDQEPEGLVHKPSPVPAWDDDGWLEDPEDERSDATITLRVSSRPPVYRLERGALAGVGLEGDLLVGWRGGDAIAAELS